MTETSLETPSARRARVGRFRTLRDLDLESTSPRASTPLRELLRLWREPRGPGRVFLVIVPTVPGSFSEREQKWLLDGISIREACTAVPETDVRMVILRDRHEQAQVLGIYGGAGILTDSYVMPRLTMGRLGQLMRSWEL